MILTSVGNSVILEYNILINKGAWEMKDTKLYRREEDFSNKGMLTPGVSEEMLNYEFWTSRIADCKELVMNDKEIEAFNEQIIEKINSMYKLDKYKESLSKKELMALIDEYKFTDKMKFDYKGNELKEKFFDSLLSNINLEGIKEDNNIKYGISINKLALRSFPTEVGAYENSDATLLDRFQENGCGVSEAVLILHESKDREWYFIQMYNYRGWVKAEGIAIAKNKTEVFDYINSNSFLMVTGNHVSIEENNQNINRLFSMGDKITLTSEGELYDKYKEDYYVVKLPIKTKEGFLGFSEALIEKSKDLVIGFLPYTRENIVKQAFKLQGDEYDWGNKSNGRDCSSFIASIYKTVGILLPRNADEQENSFGKQYKFLQEDALEKRNEILDNVKPGAAIFLPGHVTMYIGKLEGVHYIIHDFLGYGKKNGNKYNFVLVYSVTVTTTILTTTSGTPYIKKFTSAVQFEK
jgi:hypothetical protein